MMASNAQRAISLGGSHAKESDRWAETPRAEATNAYHRKTNIPLSTSHS
ncbi:hypothetical protein B0G76_4809 [Paraburkholderia sp. BL23I1N1]|nr:hypothetical protein B0G76_4809 [Paraburkholderia sp. BL23I1N1]